MLQKFVTYIYVYGATLFDWRCIEVMIMLSRYRSLPLGMKIVFEKGGNKIGIPIEFSNRPVKENFKNIFDRFIIIACQIEGT